MATLMFCLGWAAGMGTALVIGYFEDKRQRAAMAEDEHADL